MIEFDLLKLGPAQRVGIAEDVRADLELDKVVGIASGGDKLVAETWLEVLLSRECSEEVIRYRQEAVRDALEYGDVVLRMYQIAKEGYETAYREVFIFRLDNPSLVVYEVSKGIRILADYLEKLLNVVSNAKFSSSAFKGLVRSLTSNIDEEFIARAREISEMLRFGSGAEFSVGVGSLNSLVNPTLLLPEDGGSIIGRLLPLERRYTYRLDLRDEDGARILGDIRNWVLSRIATTLLNSFEKFMSFFRDLAKQISFYVGAINLSNFLDKLGIPRTYPEVDPRKFFFENLYPLSLAVSSTRKPVPSSLYIDVEGSFAAIITGVNKGGKTTFLKSVGQAILIARAGLPVPAERFVIPSAGTVLTHFLREEESVLLRKV